jgi:nucleotide-binding universal stress UspA family protein
MILVALDRPEAAGACLRAAADAARALPGARLSVLCIRMDPAGVVQYPDVLTERVAEALEARSASEAAALRAAFDAWRAEGHPVEASWIDIDAVPATAIAERGRQAALLVLARPTAATHPANAAGFDAALFDTGRPLLAVPAGAFAPFGRHIAVGWRDAAATRRSLAALRPWLLAADRVSVIAVTDGAAALPGDLPAGATLHVVRPAGRSDGTALLQEAAALGADGLAIGAYRRGRLMERLLGGVTADVLRDATIPVLMHV